MKIGVFDSGYGGLSILQEIRKYLPQYDYVYLGDNARAPYGSRSFDVVYKYTWECVRTLFEMDCQLVIIACNTASAKALRSIQQNDLVEHYPERRVLGIIRPTAEVIGGYSKTGKVGVMATEGTVQSGSYPIEIGKQREDLEVVQQACPMFVPLVENGEQNTEAAEYFARKYVRMLYKQEGDIDAILLACTHYPLMYDVIKRCVPEEVVLLTQGEIVARSLEAYLERHSEIEQQCSKMGNVDYFTTENGEKFGASASLFLNENIEAKQIVINY